MGCHFLAMKWSMNIWNITEIQMKKVLEKFELFTNKKIMDAKLKLKISRTYLMKRNFGLWIKYLI